MRTKPLVFAAACFAAAALAQDIRITSGPVDNQVLQRNADQTADLRLAGTAVNKKANGKEIEARLIATDSSTLPGFDWTALEKSRS